MAEGGQFVIMEGREQTLNYVRTPLRFELKLADELIIGKRQAALKITGKAIKDGVKAGDSSEEVEAACKKALADLLAARK